MRKKVALKYLPRPDFLEFSLPDSHLVVLTSDGTELTTDLKKELEAKGNQVVVLYLPGMKTARSLKGISINEASDEAVSKAVAEIQKTHGKIGCFIHLHPQFVFKGSNFTQHFKKERELIKTVFLLAKHTHKDLNELGQTSRAAFLTVSRMDGMLGQGKRGNVSVVGGGLTGLVKCLNLEWSPVFCRAIDIEPEMKNKEIAAHIHTEWHDANSGIIEVAISEEGRKTTSVEAEEVGANQVVDSKITKDSVFFVSGGAKGVTAKCVVEMAKTFSCKFILLGRSSVDGEIPQFAKAENEEAVLKRLIMEDLKARGEKPSLAVVKKIFKDIAAKKEIFDTINQIKKYGGEVEYIKGDVTNFTSFSKPLKAATKQLGKITGLIHGAGRLADKYIQDKSEEDFDNVLSVKLDGLLSLLKSVDINSLEHLVLFSSVAGFYGNVGQTDYAIANEILSKAALLFKTNHPKTHVSAINWGAWDSGMVSGELKAQFEAAGVVLVNSDGGPAMMINELQTKYSDQAQMIIGGTLPAGVSYIGDLKTHKVHRHLKLNDNPFLMHHVIQGKAVLPVVNAVGWMAQTAEKLYPDYRVFQVQNTKLFKGIVFDGNQKDDYVVELKEVSKNSERITFECAVLSKGAKLPTYHYKAKVILVSKKVKIESPRFSHQLSGEYVSTPGDVLYKDGSLFHYTYFRGIENIIDFTEKQIVMSCKAPEVPLKDQGQFPVLSVNTFFSDIQYQGMVVWVQRYRDGAKSLPLQTDSAILYHDIPFNKRLFVHVKIENATDFQMVATCTVYDKEGKVYMVSEGATLTVSKQLVW